MTDDIDAALLIEDAVPDRVGEAPGECFSCVLHGCDRVHAGGVELHAIAGRDEKRLVEASPAGDFAELLLEAIGRDGEAFSDLHGRRTMGEADDHEVAHQAWPPRSPKRIAGEDQQGK